MKKAYIDGLGIYYAKNSFRNKVIHLQYSKYITLEHINIRVEFVERKDIVSIISSTDRWDKNVGLHSPTSANSVSSSRQELHCPNTLSAIHCIKDSFQRDISIAKDKTQTCIKNIRVRLIKPTAYTTFQIKGTNITFKGY